MWFLRAKNAIQSYHTTRWDGSCFAILNLPEKGWQYNCHPNRRSRGAGHIPYCYVVFHVLRGGIAVALYARNVVNRKLRRRGKRVNLLR